MLYFYFLNNLFLLLTVPTSGGNGLNLRSSPGGSILKVVPNYSNVVMLNYNYSYSGGENWSRVDYNGTVGYVATRFLATQNKISYYYVKPEGGNGLNLRSSPNGSIKLVIPNYTPLYKI